MTKETRERIYENISPIKQRLINDYLIKLKKMENNLTKREVQYSFFQRLYEIGLTKSEVFNVYTNTDLEE